MTGSDPAAVTERAVTAILAAFTGGDSRGVVVDSPPGAGKSTLVARAAIQLAEADEPVMVVAQTNEQVGLDRTLSCLRDKRAAALRLARITRQVDLGMPAMTSSR